MRPLAVTVWPSLPPAAHLRRRQGFPPFPLDDRRCRLFSLGRHALWHGVRALELEPGDEVLVPAFHHGAEVEALLRAGLGCRFYEVGEDLAPLEPELDDATGPRVRALHLTHYLGLPQDAPRWRAWCDQRGLLLLEDAAQSWLARTGGRPVGAWGDLAIFSLYKAVGVPDGAALVARTAPVAGSARGATPVGELVRRHGAWLLQRAPALARDRRGPGHGVAYDPAGDFALGDPNRPVSRTAARLLARLAVPAVPRRRRENHRYLQTRLGELVAGPFRELPDGASPMVVPLAVAEKEPVLRALARAGIEGLNLWSVPHPALPEPQFTRSRGLRASIVGLPVHQELRRRDLDRMLRALEPVVRTAA